MPIAEPIIAADRHGRRAHRDPRDEACTVSPFSWKNTCPTPRNPVRNGTGIAVSDNEYIQIQFWRQAVTAKKPDAEMKWL